MNNEQIIDEQPRRERTGPPWENRDRLGFFTAIWETIKGVLINPTQTFAEMRTEGGIGMPILYAIILGSIGGIAGVVWQGLFSTLDFMANQEIAKYIASAVPLVLMTTLMPIIIAIGLFISSGIVHVCLIIVGGPDKGLEATFKIFAYTSGSVALFQIVPFCGGIVGFVWGLVCEIIGLKEAHGTTTGKAILAILLPIIFAIFYCVGVILLILILGIGSTGALYEHFTA
ncbi:YIP1 family protein [bacterium]|nr:YIP1 family protein [bacterium]